MNQPAATLSNETDHPSSDAGRKPDDLEVKDAQLIFASVWKKLEEEFGQENLIFPPEISWLNGAPGAGKGTQTRFIMKFRDLTAEPVVVSSLLKSPEARKLIDAGLMVGDREVLDILLRKLLSPGFQSGALVDGFPRTLVQVECLKLFYGKLMELRNKYVGTSLEKRFPKPQFHIIVLFIDEAESVKRQLIRGKRSQEDARTAEEKGEDDHVEIRKTDLSEDSARNRYRTFKRVTYEALKSLREVFHYHFIDAKGSIEDVQHRIIGELAYQSSLELDQATYDRVSRIPIAQELIVHARQELVKRLNEYEENHSHLFHLVLEHIQEKFLPIVRRHAISGMAMVSSEDQLFDTPLALAILIDVFSERGYHATVDIRHEYFPERIDPDTQRIISRMQRIYRFIIRFRGSEIRRGG